MNETLATHPSSFVWYELMTTDLDAAKAFYSAVVGWKIHEAGMGGPRYEIFGNEGIDVGGMMSWASVGESFPAGWMAHIHTADVDAEAAAVQADGGGVLRPPSEIPGVGRFAVVHDPQGAGYLLFQPNQAAAPPRLAPPTPGSVGWHELGTTDWAGAWEFYSKRYGWRKDVAVDMGPMGTYQTFSAGEAGGGMMTVPPAMRPEGFRPAWLYYFVVDSINAAAERVKGNGGEITYGPAQVPGGGWIVQAIDPQGGKFALTAMR